MAAVIWDWNGTLLNDLDHCIATINVLLEKRKLPMIDHSRYKDVFSFPVKEYYQSVGFDFSKENFEIPAKEFIDLYDRQVKNCPLHDSAIEVLSFFKEHNISQFVLSAMKQEMLEETLKHNRISHFFEAVAGLNDHYAVSKIERGKQLIRQFEIDKKNTFIIGDTIHDFEVARELGTACILIADGHQSKERLQKTGSTVISALKDLMATSEIKELFQ